MNARHSARDDVDSSPRLSLHALGGYARGGVGGRNARGYNGQDVRHALPDDRPLGSLRVGMNGSDLRITCQHSVS